MKTQVFLCAAAALVSSVGAASAASPWPASVVGAWPMAANQSTLTLTITSQTGATTCMNIKGTLVDSVNGPSNIVGYYCPDSGKISFLRNSTTTGLTFQAFTGNLSYPGTTTYMAGVFEQEGQPTPGEYDFFAEKRASK